MYNNRINQVQDMATQSISQSNDNVFTNTESNLDQFYDTGYVEEVTLNKGKKFNCKSCSKSYKTEHSIRQHVESAHVNKRKRGEDESTVSITTPKRPLLMETVNESQIVRTTAAFCQEFMSNPGDVTLSEMSILNPTDVAAMNSTAIDDEHIKPDQDHDYILEEDMLLLRTRVKSLESELKKKDNIIGSQRNELEIAQMEAVELTDRITDSEKSNQELKASLESALVQTNILEGKIAENEKNLRLFSGTIKRLQAENSKNQPAAASDKDRKLSSAEARCKQLSQRLAELEAVNDSEGVELKIKEIEDKLHAKTKELKNKESCLRKSDKTVKELNEKLTASNKKVLELENSNVRLQLIADQAKADVESKLKDTNESKRDVRRSSRSPRSSKRGKSYSPRPRRRSSSDRRTHTRRRCEDDNTGRCKKGRSCRDIHAKQTCQPHSKFGSCPFVSQCEQRHPNTVCYEWQQSGSCRFSDECRHRHPHQIHPSSYQECFLGGRAQGHQDRPQNQWPAYRHHDQRGNRW